MDNEAQNETFLFFSWLDMPLAALAMRKIKRGAY